jgi:hypothetical protein
MATQLAISLAKSLNMDHFIIEGDFEVVAPSLNNPNLIIYSEDLFFNSRLFRLLFLLLSFGRLERFQEVQTSMPTQWHVGSQSDLTLAVFSCPLSLLYFLLLLLV